MIQSLKFYSGSTMKSISKISVSKGAPRVTTISTGSPYSYGRSLYNFDLQKELSSNVYVNGRLVGGKAFRVYKSSPNQSDRKDTRELEKDYSDWANKYAVEPEQGPPPEYPFHDFNYGDVYG